MSEPRVLLLTRPGCHLCEEAERVIEEVCAATGEQWRSQDISGDAELTRRYTDQVPVIFVDGIQHDFWRVDPRRLTAALARPAR
jgi:glutaredoxin